MNPQGASAFTRGGPSVRATSERSTQNISTSRISQHSHTNSSRMSNKEQMTENQRTSIRTFRNHVGASSHAVQRSNDDDDDFIDEDISNISTHNSSMAHVHADFNKINIDLFDNDDIS
jgi:hypothetical protein